MRSFLTCRTVVSPLVAREVMCPCYILFFDSMRCRQVVLSISSVGSKSCLLFHVLPSTGVLYFRCWFRIVFFISYVAFMWLFISYGASKSCLLFQMLPSSGVLYFRCWFQVVFLCNMLTPSGVLYYKCCILSVVCY